MPAHNHTECVSVCVLFFPNQFSFWDFNSNPLIASENVAKITTIMFMPADQVNQMSGKSMSF